MSAYSKHVWNGCSDIHVGSDRSSLGFTSMVKIPSDKWGESERRRLQLLGPGSLYHQAASIHDMDHVALGAFLPRGKVSFICTISMSGYESKYDSILCFPQIRSAPDRLIIHETPFSRYKADSIGNDDSHWLGGSLESVLRHCCELCYWDQFWRVREIIWENHSWFKCHCIKLRWKKNEIIFDYKETPALKRAKSMLSASFVTDRCKAVNITFFLFQWQLLNTI